MTELPVSDLENWRELPAADRRQWWNQLWLDAIALADRYRLALRSGWWEDSIQVEALQAFTAWVSLYDSSAYTDPPGKLQLLFELERLRAILRAGEHAFDASRDRADFERHVACLGSVDDGDPEQGDGEPQRLLIAQQRSLALELASVTERLAELQTRARVLAAELARRDTSGAEDFGSARAELDQLRRTIGQLERRERELRSPSANSGLP